MSSWQKTASNCNRQPFLSEDGCDRGFVDIHQFDDLPYCESISTTEPEIPPEIVDTPLNLQIPPSCSCVNIDYKFSLKYSGDRAFKAYATFDADGDCCEGNYVSDFDLQIPCPVIGDGPKRINMSVGYGNGASSKSVEYISTNSKNCTVSPKDVDIRLDVPCPLYVRGNGTLTIGIEYGNGDSRLEGIVVAANTYNCSIGVVEQEYNLNIPCPILGQAENRIRTTARFSEKFSENNVVYIRKDNKSCTIEPLDVDLQIDVPCPIYESDRGGKVKISIGYGDGENSSEGAVINADRGNCTISPIDADFNLNIRCPFSRAYAAPWESIGNGRYRLRSRRRIMFGWRSQEVVFDSYADFMTVDTEGCTFDVENANLDLTIPCPIYGDGANTSIKLNPKFSNSGNSRIEIIRYNRQYCRIDVPDVSYDLNIECPIDETTIGLNKARYGTPINSQTSINDGDCKIGGLHKLDLVIPCALSGLNLIAGDNISILPVTDRTYGGSCLKTFKISAKGGGGGGGGVSSLRYVSNMRCSGSSIDFEITEISNGRYRSKWQRLTTATNHMSDHACCNDATA